MRIFKNSFFIQLTLIAYFNLLIYHPAYGVEITPFAPEKHDQHSTGNITVAYIEEHQVTEFTERLRHSGYTVREGTLQEVNRIKNNHTDTNYILLAASDSEYNIYDYDCSGIIPGEQLASAANPESMTRQQCESLEQELDWEEINNISSDLEKRKIFEEQCRDMLYTGSGQDQQVDQNEQPPPEEINQQHSTVSTNVHIDVSGSGNSGGGGSGGGDLAKVLFVLIGVVVVAVLFVYAGKYIVDIIRGKEQEYWWEIGFHSLTMNTDSGQHGRFHGVKIATGVVSNELVQLGLVGEVGRTDLDLIINEDSLNPLPLDLSANYWMLGATVRLHLSDKLINPSYLYLEFLGGTTDQSETDIISSAKAGINFGVQEKVRLGFSIGSQYLGLNDDDGFTDNNDNFWLTYGMEFGIRF